jgi:hypothetical protein
MNQARSRSWLPSGLALFLTVCIGCSRSASDRGAIHGNVQLDGKPLEKGSILFIPIEGTRGVVAGTEIENGHFQISQSDGPAVGWNRVEIRSLRKSGRLEQKPYGLRGEMIEHEEEAVETKYNTASMLKEEIRTGSNAIDFQVTSAAVKRRR